MVEEEEYDSDVSDRTVLLTDYVDKPEKIVMKRRRLSNLLDKDNRSDEFEEENSAPDDSSVNRRTGLPAKKKNNLDKTLHIQKYLESISKNNDAKNRGDLDFYQKHVPTNFEFNKSNYSKRKSIDIDTDDQIINLDSDDETQNADKSQGHVRKSDETPARKDRIIIPNSPHKPAPFTNRRGTTGIIEQNKIQLKSNVSQTPEEDIQTIIPNNDNTKSENESKAHGYKDKILKLPKIQSAGVNANGSAGCDNVTGICTAILDKNPHSSSPSTSKPPLKTDIGRYSSLSNQDSRTDKRFGSYNETQTEPKRIKIDIKSTDPGQFNKMTQTQVKNTAGAVNEKRAPVDSIDAKSTSTVNSVKSDKATPNIQNTSLNANEKLESNKIYGNVTSDKHKVIDVASERCDGLDENKARNFKSTTGSVNEKGTPIAIAFDNVCENREIPEASIIKETSKLRCKKDTIKVQGVEVVVVGADDQGERKALDEFGSSRLHDEQGTSEIHDKRETNKVQGDLENTQDKQVSEVQSESKINETYDQLETNELKTHQAQHKTRNILDKTGARKPSVKQQFDKVQDSGTDKLDSEDEDISTIPSEAIEIHDRLETQKVNNENETTEATNLQKTVKGNETTRYLVDAEDNDRILKFQVGFFTLVKEYLKDIFPESAMELHGLIQTLIINTRNGEVQTEVKYSCPKCSLVSNYSSRILNNAVNEENKENVDNTKKCGFCNGIRKLHISYLKRFLGKKYSIGDKKEVVKKVTPRNDHAIQTEQSRRSLAEEIVFNNSQTTSEKTTDKESTSLAALEKQTSCIFIVDNDKQVKYLPLTADNTTIYEVAKKHSLLNETPSKKISQLDICPLIDNSVKKDAVNTASPVARGSDTIKNAGKERSDQDTPIIKDNEICDQNKSGHKEGEASTAHSISNKRKSAVAHKETTEHKRAKTGTGETNVQGVKNLTATDSQTNIQRHENERPEKVQIKSQQNVSSYGTEKLNRSLESDPSNNTGINSATNSEHCENAPEKPSNESTNTIDRNTHEVCLKPVPDADELDKSIRHCSEEINQPVKEVTSEDTFGEERRVEVNGNDKGKEKHSNKSSTGSVPETDEANAKQISNGQRNDKDDEGVLKPLMDCFVKIKNCVNEKESTPSKAQQDSTASKIRSRVRSDGSDSLDSLPNRDHRKIVKKYVCPICTSMYAYASKLLQHMKKSHNQNLTAVPENCDWLECPFCRTLLSNKNYNKHVKQYHIEKVDESVGVIENNNTNKCKNMTLLNRNTESNKTSESERSKNDCFTSDNLLVTDNATKKQRHSETKYLQLIKRINIRTTNKDEKGEIHDGENEKLGPDADVTKNSIEREDVPPATLRKITSYDPANSTASALHVNHTERCCDESDRSPGLKSDARQNTSIIEEERSPLDCNDEKIDSIEDVSSIRKDNIHDISETCHGDNNDTESHKTKTLKSNTSQESKNNRKDVKDHSRRRVSNDEYNESELSNSHGIDKDTVKNGKQHNNKLLIQYKNNGLQSTENTVMSVRSEEQETDNEEDCIQASDYTVKKRKERTAKLFGDENENSVSNKIKNSKSNRVSTKRPTSNRKADHRTRGITVEKYTESAESSDSDWIIGDDENSDSHDETFCTVKKQQVVRTLFSDENVQSSRNEESHNRKDGDNQSTKTGDSNGSDDDTIKSSKHAVNKKKERLSELFGGDDETSISDNINEKDDIQAGIEKNGYRSDRQCAESEEGDKENAPSICEQEIPADDETLKVSKHMIKKRRERILKHFSDEEALEQNNESNKQMENSEINNADCRVPRHHDTTVHDIRTKNVNVSECNVERPDISRYGTNYENCVNGHQGTTCKERGKDCHVDGATVRNDIRAVAEEIIMNAVSSENKTRDEDQIEINMIDSLLNELASNDQQSGESSEKENADNVRKSEVSSESQATSESAIDKTCLENIRITNVTSVEGKTHVFICQECNYGTDAYDNAIRHCQNHYNSIEDQVTYCDICQINYETICFERHQASHDEFVGNMKIRFSYMWLLTNWQMVFENNNILLSEAEDMQVKSIFKTYCVKMTVKENGPWQSAVYMCAKCNTCVPPLNVEQHVQEKCRSVNYPCSVCDLLFLTCELRKHHEMYHTDDASKPFKTIVFNYHNEDSFNSKLIQVKAQSKEKQGTVDIFKCLCGLCFNSLKKFKLHFADCDSELNDGRQCPRCTGVRRFSNTDLEEHLLLHQSLFNCEFRVQRIMFQQESIIDSSEREASSATSDGTGNTTQKTHNDEDLDIKTYLLKYESLTQNAGGEDRQENIGTVEDEDINILTRSNDEDLIIKDELLKDESLTQNTNEVNSKEIPDSDKEETNRDVEEESSQEIKEIEGSDDPIIIQASQEVMELEVSDDPITIQASQEMEVNDEDLDIKTYLLKYESLTQNAGGEDRQENIGTVEDEDINILTRSNDEDLIIKDELLKDESLTQNTNEVNSKEIPDSDKEETNRDVEEESSQEIKEIEQSDDPIIIQASQEVMEVAESDDPIIIQASQEVIEVAESDDPITIQASQDMEVEGSENLITIEDSDDDVKITGGSFPNLTQLFPLRYCSERYKKQSGH